MTLCETIRYGSNTIDISPHPSEIRQNGGMTGGMFYYFIMSGNTQFEPIGNKSIKGVRMTLHDFKSENLPETLSMEQIRLICHISKLTARFYVKSGLLKNKNSGKQTRCYTVTRKIPSASSRLPIGTRRAGIPDRNVTAPLSRIKRMHTANSCINVSSTKIKPEKGRIIPGDAKRRLIRQKRISSKT